MALGLQEALSWRGRKAVDPAGTAVGTVIEIFLDDGTGEPEWLLLETGWFSSERSFVPVVDARGEDETVRVAYAKEVIADAPRVTPDQSLNVEEETRLYAHYGVSGQDATDDAPRLRPAGEAT